MTRNKSTDALKQIGGGSGGRQFSLGSAGPGVGTDGQIFVTAGGVTAWATPNYVTKPELATELAPLVSGIEHGAAVADIIQEPTGAEPDGSLYIVGTAPTGAFAGHANEVAFLDKGAWLFTAPQQNEAHLNEASNRIMHWSGTTWNSVGTVAQTVSSANIVAFDQATLDRSGTLLTLAVNVTQNHLYQIVGYIMCVYDNYNDSYVGQIVRRHTNDPDLLIGFERSQGWDSIYYSAVNMCAVDLADHTGIYNYELQLPKYSGGVVAKKYSLTVMDLGPKP